MEKRGKVKKIIDLEGKVLRIQVKYVEKNKTRRNDTIGGNRELESIGKVEETNMNQT